MKAQIRFAKRTDLPAIIGLVIDLAIFEQEPDAVTANLDDYNIAFDKGLIHAFVAEIDNEIVGMALYYNTFSTWKGNMLHLEDFIVKETYRNHGIGSLLFNRVIEEAKSRKCHVLKWQVLHWNEDAIRFYKRKQSVLDKRWWEMKLYFD
ncbi:MAG: GNAT family N-acetyltransferase [Saprospiraceae bacterium]|nr:GNAT family N-acetyltransferase [Bacteroidia bacterium]MBT8229587.1 GNAT family N-acetyltransferase [Bacteroidia bacterium]NNF21137.1 GNAT family N-acetyltransferase [Saprospiraceae bacterium]NNK88999.1 GNAT family N-acetyltransferase [Saprospiraceae bacterium]